jgi:hypothetical protein
MSHKLAKAISVKNQFLIQENTVLDIDTPSACCTQGEVKKGSSADLQKGNGTEMGLKKFMLQVMVVHIYNPRYVGG